MNEEQPFFVYAAVDLSPSEAQKIIANARSRYRIQAPELKSRVLRKRVNWSQIAGEIAAEVEGRAAVIAFDKRLNLAGKTFEYFFEPVLQDNSLLFYRHNLHRFLMNAVHRVMLGSGQRNDALAAELQEFMRTFEPMSAPSLFSRTLQGSTDSSVILDCMLRFIRGYSSTIEVKTAHLRAGESDIGKWTLDLSSSGLFSLVVRHWGLRYPRIELLCDDSQPLRASISIFDNFIDRPDGFELTDGRRNSPARCNLAGPVAFGSSAEHPTLQVADILAGATADTLRCNGNPSFVFLDGWVKRHLHEDHVLPDNKVIDTRAQQPRANLEALRELARRADFKLDALLNMDSFYISTMARFKSPASRLRLPPRKRK